MLTKRYMPSLKNIHAIFQKIIEGTAPDKFNREHLKGIGFPGSNDRAMVPLLKDLGFLTSEGVPTQRYHDYRDSSKSQIILGEALKEAYADLFHVNENPTEADKPAIQGKFKTTHNVKDRVSEQQTATFYTLLKIADINAKLPAKKQKIEKAVEEKRETKLPPHPPTKTLNLRYNIEIHLPATKDVEVYNAIFKALRDHLGE